MNISEFVFRLLLLFLPGIISSFIIDMFTVHKARTQYQILIHSFLLGLMSYFVYWIIISVLSNTILTTGKPFSFLHALNNSKDPISYEEIVYVCILSVFIGLLITAIHTYKLHSRLMQKLRITKKFGELDVWGYLMNSPDTLWVTVRDISNNLMYDGWVQAFSDNSKEAELLLGDVVVYKNDTGERLYDVATQYLSLDKNNMSIEIRDKNDKEVEND